MGVRHHRDRRRCDVDWITKLSATSKDVPSDDQLDAMTRDEKVRLGTNLDGVEIIHREPRFPEPGTKAEKRSERIVAGLAVNDSALMLAGAAPAALLALLVLITPLLAIIVIQAVPLVIMAANAVLMPHEERISQAYVSEASAKLAGFAGMRIGMEEIVAEHLLVEHAHALGGQHPAVDALAGEGPEGALLHPPEVAPGNTAAADNHALCLGEYRGGVQLGREILEAGNRRDAQHVYAQTRGKLP